MQKIGNLVNRIVGESNFITSVVVYIFATILLFRAGAIYERDLWQLAVSAVSAVLGFALIITEVLTALKTREKNE